MKVVINRCYGGFSLSKEATEHMAAAGSVEAQEALKPGHYYFSPDNRSDPLLVAAVEALGEMASGHNAELKIVEVPDEVKWTIEEYDGIEWVAEVHRRWE